MAIEFLPANLAARRRLIGLLMLLAGAAVFIVDHAGAGDDSDVVLPVTRARAASEQPAAAVAAASAAIRPERMRQMQLAKSLASALKADAGLAAWPSPSDAARRSWEAAPAPPAPRAEATSGPTPTAPDAPFQWVGLWEQPAAQGGRTTDPVAIVAASSGTRLVRAGDLLEDDWKVDKIYREQLQLTYLPLGTRQTLSMNKK